MITKKQQEHGFWIYDKKNSFPPDHIENTTDYRGEPRVNIACTQRIDLKPADQKKLLKSWIAFLPLCEKLEFLWFTSHTTQSLFDAACTLGNLQGLNIKWSNIKSLDKIANLKQLKYLRIGSSSQITGIEPLTELPNLEVLSIENFKKVSDFSALKKLTRLKFLEIEGGMWMKQNIDTFEPISSLEELTYLSMAMIQCPDKTIDPILKLRNLETLDWPFDLSAADMERLKIELPRLRHFSGRHFANNMQKVSSWLNNFGKTK